MYFIVPIKDGELDIDYSYLDSLVVLSQLEACVKLRNGFTVRPSWQSITEEEWLAAQPPEPEPGPPPETTAEKLARLEQQNLIIMDALADLYEEILSLKGGDG